MDTTGQALKSFTWMRKPLIQQIWTLPTLNTQAIYNIMQCKGSSSLNTVELRYNMQATGYGRTEYRMTTILLPMITEEPEECKTINYWWLVPVSANVVLDHWFQTAREIKMNLTPQVSCKEWSQFKDLKGVNLTCIVQKPGYQVTIGPGVYYWMKTIGFGINVNLFDEY